MKMELKIENQDIVESACLKNRQLSCWLFFFFFFLQSPRINLHFVYKQVALNFHIKMHFKPHYCHHKYKSWINVKFKYEDQLSSDSTAGICKLSLELILMPNICFAIFVYTCQNFCFITCWTLCLTNFLSIFPAVLQCDAYFFCSL